MAHFQRQPITLIVMGHVRSSGEARFRFKMADLTSKDKPTTKRKNILDYFGQRNEHSQDVESEKTAAVTESNDESSSVSKKVKYDHTFQQEWLEDWPWLRHDTKGMSCYLLWDFSFKTFWPTFEIGWGSSGPLLRLGGGVGPFWKIPRISSDSVITFLYYHILTQHSM